VFSQFGDNIYASDVVQQAIYSIVTEMKKLNPQHIRIADSKETSINGQVQRLLDCPNPTMTTSDFLEKIVWQLFLNYNSFIIPTYKLVDKTKQYTGLYPIQPKEVNFLEDESGELGVEFSFNNGYKTLLRYEDVIHIKYRYSVNELMGGNESGQPDNSHLLKTLELNNILLDGVGKALKSSFSINGVVRYGTLLDSEKMDKAIKDIEERLSKNESGFLPIDIKSEFIPLNKNIQLVDDKTLKFIDEKILRHFGVPLPILTGDYTKAQFEAFHNNTLEPLMISISQELTKKLFTKTELGYGNKIVLYSKDLVFMDIAQKITFLQAFAPTGGLYQNEIRRMFGLSPIAELDGVSMQSLNYVNAENATEYQMKGAKQNEK
jgi:HK97 family phage portal protein